MIFRSGIYELDVDVDRTRQFYTNENYEFCTCAGCRNFSKAYSLLPEVVQRFFQQFGIHMGKPAEISAYNSVDGNSTFYGGFYHICGTVLTGKNPWQKTGKRTYSLDQRYALNLTGDCSVFFTDACSLVEKDFPAPVIQMEFQCSIPWVLEEPNPYYDPKLLHK